MLADRRMSGPDRFFLASLGVISIWFGINGLSSGEIFWSSLDVSRSKNPLLFWCAIVSHFVIGIMALLASAFNGDFWK